MEGKDLKVREVVGNYDWIHLFSFDSWPYLSVKSDLGIVEDERIKKTKRHTKVNQVKRWCAFFRKNNQEYWRQNKHCLHFVPSLQNGIGWWRRTVRFTVDSRGWLQVGSTSWLSWVNKSYTALVVFNNVLYHDDEGLYVLARDWVERLSGSSAQIHKFSGLSSAQ